MKTLLKKAGIVVAAAAAGALSFAPLAFAGTAVSPEHAPKASSEKCENTATQTNTSPATAIGAIAAAVSAAVPVNAAANAASCDNISALNGTTVGVGIAGIGANSSGNGTTTQS